MTRTKLEISLAMVLMGIIGTLALWKGTAEIVSSCVTGIGMLGMKLLEK